jgi:hypothetical protein
MVAQARLVLDAYLGTPTRPGIPGRPGVMEQLTRLAGDVAKLNAQVTPNGGSSLRDAVDQLGDSLSEHREQTSPAIRGLASDMAEVKTDIAGVKEDVAKMAGRMDVYEGQRVTRDLTRWPGNPPGPAADPPRPPFKET